MRILFLGSPAFAIPTLRVLADGPDEIVAVVTQPDRPAGRGRVATPPPVKPFALERGLRVLQPANINAPDAIEVLTSLEPGVMVVAAYGQILRRAILDLPKRGSLNVHASLLPRHRGAAPVAAAILAGDELTGVSVMEIVRALDAGPVVASVAEPISPHDTTAILEARLAERGAQLLAEVIGPWARGELKAASQDADLSTYDPMIRREDARIDWHRPAVEIWRQVRAYDPWPIANTQWENETLRVWEAWPVGGESGKPAGTVLGVDVLPEEAGTATGLLVQTGAGRLAILKAQRPGRRVHGGEELARGARGLIGSVLG